jgi:hypothetical protein
MLEASYHFGLGFTGRELARQMQESGKEIG